MPRSQRRPAGGHRHRHTRLGHPDDVGVALDHHRRPGADDLALRLVQPVQQSRLVIQRRLGGVEVLGAFAALHPAGAEAHRVASQVEDRKHHPPSEPIDEAAAAATNGQPCAQHSLLRNSRMAQVADQGVPPRRREAELETLDRAGVVATAAQVSPRRTRVGTGAQRVLVEVDGSPDRRHQLLPLPAAPGCARLDVQRDPGPACQQLHGVGEVDVLCLLHPAEQVAALAAPETVIQAARAVHGERGRLLLVERADGHGGAAAPLDLGDFADQLDQVRCGPHPLDVVTPVGHRRRV